MVIHSKLEVKRKLFYWLTITNFLYIIILLIFAGITIAQLTGSGLFEKTKTAKEQYQNAEDDEEDKIAKYSNEIDSYVDVNRETVTIPKEEYDQLKNSKNYSTTEKVVGTWIDGKPIYQKVFLNVPFKKEILSNVDTVIEFKVSAHGIGSNSIYHDIGDGFSTTSSRMYKLSNGTLEYTSWTNNESDMSKDADFIIVQYTKTTDKVPGSTNTENQ